MNYTNTVSDCEGINPSPGENIPCKNEPDLKSRLKGRPLLLKDDQTMSESGENGCSKRYTVSDSKADIQPHNPNYGYTAVDLFAGIGGIRLGFLEAFGESFEVNMVSEIDSRAVETYRANFSTPECIEGDITEIDPKSLENFDICMAGFPCQAFSNAGKRNGFADKTRGTLFYDIIRICKYKKPLVIFCENVKGLLSIDKGKTFDIILESFREIGYNPVWKVLNSKFYDTPQNRERVYIVAFRNDVYSKNFEFPKSDTVEKTLENILERNPVDPTYFLSEQYFNTLKRHRRNHESRGHGFGYIIRKKSDIAGAIVCGGMGRERNLIIDRNIELPEVNPRTKRPFNKKNVRVMTPREWARLQRFPEDFKFPVAKTHQYRQLGNSVTVSVIEAIAKKIKPVLDNHLKNGGKRSV